MIAVGEYTKLFSTIIVGLGLIFEMPILVFFLTLMRVITERWMWRNLRIFPTRHLCYCSSGNANYGQFEHVPVCCAHGRALRDQYRPGLAGESFAQNQGGHRLATRIRFDKSGIHFNGLVTS